MCTFTHAFTDLKKTCKNREKINQHVNGMSIPTSPSPSMLRLWVILLFFFLFISIFQIIHSEKKFPNFFPKLLNLHHPNSDFWSSNFQKMHLGMAATGYRVSVLKTQLPKVDKIFPRLKVFQGFQESYLNICADSKILSEVWKLSHISGPWGMKVRM